MIRHRKGQTQQQAAALAEERVMSEMIAIFLRDVEEYDCDYHRRIEDTPDGPLIRLANLAWWQFQAWACQKYGALEGACDVQATAQLVLHSPEPVLLPCGCFVAPADVRTHGGEACAVTWDLADDADDPRNAWIARYRARQEGPAALEAVRMGQQHQSLETFVRLVLSYFLAHPDARALALADDSLDAWCRHGWKPFRAWLETPDTAHPGPHASPIDRVRQAWAVRMHLDRCARSPALKAATWQRLYDGVKSM